MNLIYTCKYICKVYCTLNIYNAKSNSILGKVIVEFPLKELTTLFIITFNLNRHMLIIYNGTREGGHAGMSPAKCCSNPGSCQYSARTTRNPLQALQSPAAKDC